MSKAFPNSFYLTNMDSKPIYVAKPPAMYIAPLWDFERGRSSPVLSSVCSEDPRTVGESLPIPKKPCIYGAVGDGRPNPSISARRRSHTVPLSTFSPKGTPVILPEDADYGAVGDGRPGTLCIIHPLIDARCRNTCPILPPTWRPDLSHHPARPPLLLRETLDN